VVFWDRGLSSVSLMIHDRVDAADSFMVLPLEAHARPV
jgi:hypothetical protein